VRKSPRARVKTDTMSALNTLVSEAVDVVVHTERGPAGPEVVTILAVEDLVGGSDAVQFTATEVFERARHGAPLAPTGQLPTRLGRAFDRAGIDLREVLAPAVEAAS